MAIEIIIKADGNSTSGGANIESSSNPIANSQNKTQAQDNQNLKGKQNKEMALITNFLVNTLKTTATQGIQAYARYTGNSRVAQQMNMALELVGNVTSVVTATIAGGPVGFAVSMASVGLNYAVKGFNAWVDLKMEERALSVMKRGLGTINMNGGRYGA